MERRMMAKNGQQKEYKAENGQEYIFQHPGLRESIRMKDRSKQNQFGVQSTEVLYEEIMKNCIFLKEGGKVDFEHFEEHGGFNEVMSEAIKFIFQEG